MVKIMNNLLRCIKVNRKIITIIKLMNDKKQVGKQ